MKVNSMAGFYSRELLEILELGRDLYRDEPGEDPEIEKVKQRVKQKVKQIEENRKEKAMTLKLVCPECGFRFVVAVPDDLPDEEMDDVRACPCGAMMKEDDTLPPYNEIKI